MFDVEKKIEQSIVKLCDEMDGKQPIATRLTYAETVKRLASALADLKYRPYDNRIPQPGSDEWKARGYDRPQG